MSFLRNNSCFQYLAKTHESIARTNPKYAYKEIWERKFRKLLSLPFETDSFFARVFPDDPNYCTPLSKKCFAEKKDMSLFPDDRYQTENFYSEMSFKTNSGRNIVEKIFCQDNRNICLLFQVQFSKLLITNFQTGRKKSNWFTIVYDKTKICHNIMIYHTREVISKKILQGVP